MPPLGSFALLEIAGAFIGVGALATIRSGTWRGYRWEISRRGKPVRFWAINTLYLSLAAISMLAGAGILLGVLPYRYG